MSNVRSFTVLPTLPDSLKDLEIIAGNMFWSWNSDLAELFRRIDGNLWVSCNHNPVKLLASISPKRLEQLAENKGFLCELRRAAEKLKSYLETPKWFDEKDYPESNKPTIAYFSAEFGIDECLPIYAGGLGILAGDYLKSASDLGVPIVGIGMLYQRGYFRQFLNVDGWQQETYAENNFYNMPIELVCDQGGRPLTISIQYPGRAVKAQIWCASIGRVKLYLLDTNIADNSSMDRLISAGLYGGDLELRIRQEIMLGIGGLRALEAMDIKASICHMNEGHAAFMALERIRQLQSTTNMTFDEALEATKAGNVFTLHTPVKAGLDEFRVELMDKYFSKYYPNLGIDRKQFLALGRIFPDDDSESFKMPILAIKLSSYRNGVSKLHGHISRQMWSGLWPGLPIDEVPIDSVTNGIHSKTWLSEEINSLYERYLGLDWTNDSSVWENIEQIPDEQLWLAHQRCKGHLITFARNNLKAKMQRRGTYHSELNRAEEILDPEILTIGFARRFASYKRGNLLLNDPQRLTKLLNDQNRPVQFVFAGKAHPKDTQGKEIIRDIIHFASQDNVRRRVVFLEDYSIGIARLLVSGVDVWLNTPRRPMEASGTSGMKAAANGVLNLSTFDGWWCEGYAPQAGWVIGSSESQEDTDRQDKAESRAIYNLLENEIIPLFYTRSTDNIPRAWIYRMKKSIARIAPQFNTHRMITEYTEKFYRPAAAKWLELNGQDRSGDKAKMLSMWKSNMKKAWPQLAIKDVLMHIEDGQGNIQINPQESQLRVGSQLTVRALIKLGQISPEDVSVELYHGPMDSRENIREGGSAIRMDYAEPSQQTGEHWFIGSIPCVTSGRHVATVRILPSNQRLGSPYEMGLILWETPVVVSSPG